jgi:hypothetical protein
MKVLNTFQIIFGLCGISNLRSIHTSLGKFAQLILKIMYSYFSLFQHGFYFTFQGEAIKMM